MLLDPLDEPGTFRVRPAMIRFWLRMPLALTRALTVVPWADAILPRVSPGLDPVGGRRTAAVAARSAAGQLEHGADDDVVRIANPVDPDEFGHGRSRGACA